VGRSRLSRGARSAQTIFAIEDARLTGIGVISLKLEPLEVEPGKLLLGVPHVWMLGVDRRWHGNGVGSKLLEALLAEVDENHRASRYVWAYVHPDNEPSHGLFEKYGFTKREPATEGHDAIRLLERY
jgi:ribosomal protein S18 acetylase RimI-like enzyme